MALDRKTAILETAVRLFYEQGYAGTSMQDIADAVGLLKGSLYHHINSKEQLLFEIHERFITVIIEKATARTQDPTISARQQLEAIMRDILEVIRDYRAYVEVFFRERHAMRGERWQTIHAKRDAYEAMVREIVRQGQRDGTFRRDLDDGIVTLGLFGMCNWSYHWLDPAGRIGIDEIAHTFVSVFLDGLQTRN